MTKQLLLALSLSLITACAADNLGSARRAILETPCAADTECPTGFECEIEVEHGVTTSFCQAHDEDGTCPDGYELEVEHGQSYCKPHGGDDASTDDSGNDDSGTDDSGNDDSTDPTGTSSGAACAVDTDCPAGEECEVEVEHGATTGTCKAHGGA